MSTEIKVYKVFDDEWEDIMGSEQLREFAVEQMLLNYDYADNEEIQDDIENFVDEDYQDKVRQILEKLYKNGNNIPCEEIEKFVKSISDEDGIQLLKIRCYDVEELNVR